MERQREDTAALCELKGWRVAYVYIDNDCSAPTARVGPSGTGCSQTAVSEHEVAMMRIRMKRAARQRAEQGIPKWKRAFGYLDDTYQPDPVTAPLVKQAYAAVLAGGSITDIARAWNAAGAYGLTGRPWTASTVSLFLRAPRNAGLRAHNDEIVGQGTWPPLVDEKTWRAAQSVLNAPGRAPGRKTVRRHLLTGVLGCGKCGHHLSGNHTNDKRITHSCKACRGVSVRAEHVEPLVMGLVAGRLARPDAVDLLKTELHDEAEAEAAARPEADTLGPAGRDRRRTRRRAYSPGHRPSAPPTASTSGSAPSSAASRTPSGCASSTGSRWAQRRSPTRCRGCHRTGCAPCSTY